MKNINIIQRLKGPTPKFFKKLRNIGVGIAIAGITIMNAPIAVPAILITAASYMVLGGSVIAAVSQLPTEDRNIKDILNNLNHKAKK